MDNQNKTIVFDLKEIGFTNLEGQFIPVSFDLKEFSNLLFNNAQSIDMDGFARALHKDGKAELNEAVEEELLEVLPKFYKFRGVQAIKEYISGLKAKND